MSTINDDDDDSRSEYTSSGDNDDDDMTIISRHTSTSTTTTPNNTTQMKNILTASIIVIGCILFLNSSMQLQHEDDYSNNSNNSYKGGSASSDLSFITKQEDLISRNAHNLISFPPPMIRGLQQGGSTEDEEENDIINEEETTDNDRNLQWIYEPETVELREQHPLISRPNLDNLQVQSLLVKPLSICGRPAAISPEQDQQIMNKFQSNCQPVGPNDPILLIEGVETFGRTGNNLIEFFHSLEKAQNEEMTVGVMLDSWLVPVITSMWMAIQDNNDMGTWKQHMELTFCIKMLSRDDLSKYTNIIHMETRDLFMYKTRQTLPDYIEFQTYHIRNLFRNYNTDVGVDIRHRNVNDMCSGIKGLFGPDKQSSQIYSVIHSRNLESAGHELLGRVAKNSGCDPEAALNMEPEYIKAILEPIGMLNYPIVFLTDHQRPEILKRLLADKDIGPMIHLVPDEASWVGGDITLGIMSNAFIGNPASTFSGFISKSRLALGFDKNYLFRAKNENGEWEDVCEQRCVFWKRILWNMA